MTKRAGLRIVHIVRAPIGGIFRHISDLAMAQVQAGHRVGLVCDALTGGLFEERAIAALTSRLALGVTRLPMRRQIAMSDFRAARQVLCHLSHIDPDVVHGHGAKGGAFGRLIGTWLSRKRPIARVYSPHGGSLHYDASALEGRLYFALERMLGHMTDALVHVSAYEAQIYRRKVGVPPCEAVVVYNGLRADEFSPVTPRSDARDLLFLGMLRDLKGTDVFLEAIAKLETRYRRLATAHLIGQADDLARYQRLARSLGIEARVSFHDPMPARDAFALARVVVVPSRAESMPYVVLEAIAAAIPIVATRVGGIPEIFGPYAAQLVPPGDADALADAINRVLADPVRARCEAEARREWIKPRFNIETMQSQIEAVYRRILASKATRQAA